MTLPHSGTRWSRFIFIRAADRVPHTAGRVDLVPRGPAHLARACGREHQQLERQLVDRLLARRPHRRHCGGGLTVRQRPHVRDDVALRAEYRPDPVGRVVAAEVHRNGPLQHGMEALPDGLGDDRLGVPDGREDRQHVGARDLPRRAGCRCAGRRSVEGCCATPDLLGVLPAALLLLDDAAGGVGKRGNALDTPLVG